ncbi:hypothetical protein RHS01_02149 [Rhizoctonia solani]|uniref:Uncharacterized protein n=1 Tax=Rhizoctonia solani TaxID=456999 RepID=A0A8H7II33_9AGAM|nr:hypothetical protein RHS01_02149 [Rhizoctonia solani]
MSSCLRDPSNRSDLPVTSRANLKCRPNPSSIRSEADATGVQWLLSSEWTPGKPTGRGRRLTMPPGEAFKEIHDLFSLLSSHFRSSQLLNTEDKGLVTDGAYIEAKHYMMKLQALLDELRTLKVDSNQEDSKQGLLISIDSAISQAQTWVEQKRALALSQEEHSKIYWRARTERRARKTQDTRSMCVIS